MAASRIEPIIQHLRRVVLREDKGMTDGQLLERFITHRDATAFEALVRRHGPMVLGVCRRNLGNPHDAEDCFQATFLVLARKAASVSPREQVGNWLYGVARTTAVRAKVANAKRRRRERQVSDMPEPEAVRQDLWNDVQPLLDEELARLPDKYRVPVVLCDLEGRPRREVARQLKIPEGTLSSRLTTSRRMLAKRLAQRGLVVTAGSLTAMLAQNAAPACMPVSLVSSTVKAVVLIEAGNAAAGVLSVKVAALAEGVVKTMFVNKIIKSSALVLLASGLALGVGGFGAGRLNDRSLASAQAGEEKDGPQEVPTGRAKKPKTEAKPKTDQEQLQGTWKIVSCVQGGVEDKSVGEWTFKDWTVRLKGQRSDRKTGTTIEFFRFRLDLTRTPKRIDLVKWEKNFEDKGEVFEGVYALDGDTLKVCLGGEKDNDIRIDVNEANTGSLIFGGGEKSDRPTVLESPKGSDAILITLKRKTKADEKRERTSSEANTPKTEEKQDRISSGTMPKTEEKLGEVKLLGQTPEDYNTIFDNVLDVVDDYFEVAYANRWDGRIETNPVFERPHMSPRSPAGRRAVTTQPVRWRAAVVIFPTDEGSYLVNVRVNKEVETKPAKIDEKKPLSPALPASPDEIDEKKLSPRPEMNWALVGRDTELEQVILRRLVEQERKRRSERPQERKEREQRVERAMSGRGHPNCILLRDVHVDIVNPDRRISVVSLKDGPTSILNLPVALDAKIKVKGGNTFRNLKVGMRLIIELSVENNQIVATGIRQVDIPPE